MSNQTAVAGGGTCILILFIMAFNFFVGGYATEYVVETAHLWIKGVPVDVPFIPCAFAGLIVGEFTIPLAILFFLFNMVG